MTSVFEELARRLRRTDLLLLRAVRRQRQRPSMVRKGQYWGSVIDEEEVEALLRAHGEIDEPATPDGLAPAVAASTALRDEPGGRVGLLRDSFGLDGDEVDLVLLATAPEISAGYARIFAYLNDNLNLAFLTVDLATRILRPTRRERLALLAHLMGPSPLVRYRLLVVTPQDASETHAARRLHPSQRFLRWLLEEEEVPPTLGFTPLDTRREPFIPAPTRQRLEELVGALDRPVTLTIVGATIGAREGTAMAVARRAGRPLVRVDLDRCREYLDQPWDLLRELRLSGAMPYLVNAVASQEDPTQRNQVLQLGAALANLPYPVLVGGADRRAVGAILGVDRPSVTLQVHRTTLEERFAAWDDAFRQRGWKPETVGDLAGRFYSVGGTTIGRICDRAQAESGGAEPAVEALWSAAREESRPEFRGLALHIVPHFTFEDLVLPDKVRRQLEHLVHYLRQQELVFHRWGMARVRSRGYGIKALFSGGPGTGKTMAAEVVAGALGLDLFRVDLSSVISRWVGETEKNLREIFDAAEGGTAIVLFDEADALFGARGEVKQAQDRFANQEVSFLLQRLEVFEGCAILTTNLQENIDEAFLRRFGAVVEFPMPTPANRRLLWERAFPAGTPRAEDLDLDWLARQFQIAGGSIVNSAVNACVLAATDGSPVSMRHAVLAVGQEMVKMGKQVSRVHFAEWFDFVSSL
ncbi:MAG: ATP-binding protein [Deltaproteobacteria bacterium]|nr:ATP-binding protein [Deltaproteobacteria bacterium]